jgi:septum site-determining protein MinC
LVDHVVRSGQILSHSGHVVVLGDVNPGASVIAGGDIIVWGRLSGMAHAGSMGDQTAVVCALEMVPAQLRIGELIARPEDVEDASPPRPHSRSSRRSTAMDAVPHQSGPEIAHIQENKIVVDPWDSGQRGA